MSIAQFARQARLGHGTQRQIARQLGVSDSVVSRVMRDKVDDLADDTVRKVRVAIARRLRQPVDDVFPPSLDASDMNGGGRASVVIVTKPSTPGR